MSLNIRVLFIIINMLMALSARGKQIDMEKVFSTCKSPEQLLAKIDSLSSLSLIPEYEADYYRSYTSYLETRYSRSVAFADSVLASDKLPKDSYFYVRSLLLKAESYIITYRLVRAANYINEATATLRRKPNMVLEANLLFLQGLLRRRMGFNEDCYKMIEEAMATLQKDKSLYNKLRVSHIMGTLTSFYIEDKEYYKAWELTLERGKLLEQIENVSPDFFSLDLEKGYYFSRMASLSAYYGRRVVAEDYCRKFMSTDMSSKPYGRVWINPFLVSVGRYEEAVRNAEDFFIFTELPDTRSSVYKRTLLESVSAYKGLKNYEMSFAVLQRYVDQQEKVMSDTDSKLLLEMSDRIEYLRYENQLNEAKDDIESKVRIIIYIASASFVLLVLLLIVIKDRRELNRKNRKIMQLMLSINENGDVFHVPTELPSDDEQEDEKALSDNTDKDSVSCQAIFSAFHAKVLEDKLYLDYQLQRDDYAEIMGVDRNRFASIIKEFTGGNLSSYLNEMRLEHSVMLFRTHPEMSIAEIGKASALPSSTTFYRLFRERYGISPKTFREQLDNQE